MKGLIVTLHVVVSPFVSLWWCGIRQSREWETLSEEDQAGKSSLDHQRSLLTLSSFCLSTMIKFNVSPPWFSVVAFYYFCLMPATDHMMPFWLPPPPQNHHFLVFLPHKLWNPDIFHPFQLSLPSATPCHSLLFQVKEGHLIPKHAWETIVPSALARLFQFPDLQEVRGGLCLETQLARLCLFSPSGGTLSQGPLPSQRISAQHVLAVLWSSPPPS